MWYYKGIKEMKRNKDDEAVKKIFDACMNNNCLTLENGELSYCSRACNAYKVQGFEREGDDFLIVNNRIGFQKELDRFLGNRHFITACRYCYGCDEAHKVPPAVQLKDTDTY